MGVPGVPSIWSVDLQMLTRLVDKRCDRIARQCGTRVTDKVRLGTLGALDREEISDW